MNLYCSEYIDYKSESGGIYVKIRISPLIIISFAAAYCFNYVHIFLLTYLIMTIHELAHLFAAVCIGLKPERFEFSPFGVHLTLKNKIIHSASDDIILYSAGPLANALMATIALGFSLKDMYYSNTLLMFMNLLPLYPLDGGAVTKRILISFFNIKTTSCLMKTISIIISICFSIFTAWGLYMKILNISIFFMMLFLIGNMVCSHELYSVDIINIVNIHKKRTNKIKMLLIDADHPKKDILYKISSSDTILGCVMKNGKVIRLISEQELIDEIAR